MSVWRAVCCLSKVSLCVCVSVCAEGPCKDMPGHVAFTLHDPVCQTSELTAPVMPAQVWVHEHEQDVTAAKTRFCPNFLLHLLILNTALPILGH